MPSSPTARILVIDDEQRIRQTVASCLEQEGHAVTTVATAQAARDAVAHEPFDLAFLDLRLGGTSGLDLMPDLLEQQPNLKVVVITAYASVETAVEAMKQGASDYLPKPFKPAQVRVAAERAAEQRALERKVDVLEEQVANRPSDVMMESESPAMTPVLDTARRAANSEATMLLRGEHGTGKGVLARAIHAWSPRSEAPFVTVHCPSLSGELLESELFGHAKGAFTGATSTNPGRVAQAEGGTLLLDEVGDLPPSLQPKLLRFVQEKKYERVGDPDTRTADVRILAATNQDLDAAVEQGQFREDLLYRLKVVELTVPPLRERPEDILPLADQFLARFAEDYNRDLEGFTDEARRALREYRWPGNVRELENAVERAVILSQGTHIAPSHLPVTASDTDEKAAESDVAVGRRVSLETLEKAHIRRVVATTETLEDAAEVLDIDPATLYRKRQKYDLV
jgi:NtrC-family two-component system response regulator AlgB